MLLHLLNPTCSPFGKYKRGLLLNVILIPHSLLLKALICVKSNESLCVILRKVSHWGRTNELAFDNIQR